MSGKAPEDLSTPTPSTPAPEPEVKAAKAAEVDPGDVFDGAPADPQGAAAPKGAATPPKVETAKGAKKKPSGGAQKGRKTATADQPTPEEVEAKRERLLQEARGYLMMGSAFERAAIRKKWQGKVKAQLLAEVLEDLELTPEELDALAVPLAQGLEEEGVEAPWYVKLLAASFPVVIRHGMTVDAKLKNAHPGDQTVDAPPGPGWDAEALQAVPRG